MDDLLSQDYFGAQSGGFHQPLRKEIIATAIEHHIMSPFTSFVAVDATPRSDKVDSKTFVVPVELPEGVEYETAIGSASNYSAGCINEEYRGLHQWFGPTDGGGFVGAPVCPRFGQSNEVGQLADYGYDTARDISRVLTLISALICGVIAVRLIVRPNKTRSAATYIFGACHLRSHSAVRSSCRDILHQ